MQTVKIYDPNDKPFGHLSNNWYYPMRINGKRWPTVTNYILSNMLTTPLYKTILQGARVVGNRKKTNVDDKVKQLITNIEVRQKRALDEMEKSQVYQRVLSEVQIDKMSIYELYNMYLGMEYFNIVRSAAEKAYNVKFTNDELVKTLLSTGNAPIEYVSNNNILGMGADGNGSNVIGKILMQIRFNLYRQKYEQDKKENEVERQNRIFNVYLASKILQKSLLDNGDISNNYINKPAEEIVEIFRGNNDMNYVYTSLDIKGDLKPTIVEMYRKGQFSDFEAELKTPGTLSLAIRKAELRNVAVQKKSQVRTIVFKTYVQYYAKKSKPSLTEEQLELVFKQLPSQAPSIREYTNIVDRVYDLYKMGELSITLSDSIDEKLKGINIPSEQEISDAEKSRPPSQAEVIEEKEEKSHSSSSTEEANPLKTMFETDDYARKRNLIGMLQQYTGRPYKYYKKKSITELEEKLQKYRETEKSPYAGHEIVAKKVQLTVSKAKIEELVTKLEEYKKEGFKEAYQNNTVVSFKEIAKSYSDALKKDGNLTSIWVLSKASAKAGGHYIRENKTRVWKPDPAMVIQKEVHFSEKVDIRTFLKSHGDPVRIMAEPTENEQKFAPFSPIYVSPLNVDGISYPNVSMYITVRLLANTGVNRTKTSITRGMSLNPAIQILRPDGKNFLSIDEANKIYQNTNKETHEELEETFLRTGINKKFESVELQELLLMTLDADLKWADSNDLLLGTGTKENPGQNLVGDVLKEKRRLLKQTYVSKDGDLKGDISKFIITDEFMYSWIEMRVKDMCKIVYQMKNYLYEQSPDHIDEKIDNRFVQTVLDTVYQPCDYMSKKITDTEIPQFFLKIVKSCPEMQFKLEKSYVTRVTESDENKETLIQANEMLEQLNKQLEEIANEYSIGKVTIVRTKEETELFNKKQRKEWEVFSTDKSLLDDGPKDRQEKMATFTTHQALERDEFYGINRSDEPNDVKANREERRKVILKKISDIRVVYKQHLQHYELRVNDIAKIYWSRISEMIRFLLQHIKDPSSLNIKTAIAQVEMLNSNPTECIQILGDGLDNCIASAILNLLTGIEQFKYQYAENIPASEEDIRLVGSIILNKDLSDVKIDTEEKEEEREEEKDFYLPREQEEEEYEEEREPDDYELEPDYEDVEDERNKDLEELDEPEEALFGFKEHNSDVERIKAQLREVYNQRPTENLTELAKFLLGMITTIKTFPISNKIKTNRINFFATTS